MIIFLLQLSPLTYTLGCCYKILGERIVVNKQGIVEIVDSASPDCTATFETDRFLFRHTASFVNLSQV